MKNEFTPFCLQEYQRKRQEALNRQWLNYAEGITRNADMLRQGVVEGVTGRYCSSFFSYIVCVCLGVGTQPYWEARRGGLKGFVKGVGRGLIGILIRPISGLFDCTSGMFGLLKKSVLLPVFFSFVHSSATSFRKLAPALRPTRVMHIDRIVRPYDFWDACGYKIFRDTNNGAFVDTDVFIGHAFIDKRSVFIITNK